MTSTGALVRLLAPLDTERLESLYPDVDFATLSRDDAPVTFLRGATVVVADWRKRIRIDDELADALASTCRLVQVMGAGLDAVDVVACAERGIRVAACGGLNAVSVAEWCIWATIDTLRSATRSDRELRAGEWSQFTRPRHELIDKKVGMVGMGAIGQETARRLSAFGTTTSYWSRTRRSANLESQLGLQYRELDHLIRESDVLILAIDLTPDTRQLISRERIRVMKAGSILVNATRGAVLDQRALVEALHDGHLAGAALDTFETEPLAPDHPLTTLESAVLTPHIAGPTVESVQRILNRVHHNIAAALDGTLIEGEVRPH